MTTVSTKEAAILSYISRHRDIGAAEWETLISSLSAPARDLALQLQKARESAAQEKALKKKDSSAEHSEQAETALAQ